MLAYHVALRKNLTSILRNGLTPRTEANAARYGEEGDAVYCFTSMASCEDALMNWLGETFEEDEALVILTVRTEGLKTRSVEVEWEVAVLETIAPERIVQVLDETGAPVPLVAP